MEGSSKNSINDWRKTYPLRKRVSEADALESIQQWLEKNEDDVSIESGGETSSEEDETEDESNEEEVNFPSPPHLQFQPDIAVSLMEDESTETGVHEDNEVLQNVPIVSRKRGHPSAEASAVKKQANLSNVATNLWREIHSNTDTRLHEFHVIGTSTPLQCFGTLFDAEVQEKLVTMINDFAQFKLQQSMPHQKHSRYTNWSNVTRYELLKLFAMLIIMGIDRRLQLSDYWSLDSLFYTPKFHELFSRNRFELLYSTMLHAGAICDDNSKKSKIEPFLNLLLVKFQSAFYPGKNLSLDEIVIKWKGRSKYKMYNPNKPEKYHIKTFGLCDSLTGYAYNVLIYFGAETSFDDIGGTGQAEKIFHSLLKPLGTGHHLFADRYYTTHKLIEYLIAKKNILYRNLDGQLQELS